MVAQPLDHQSLMKNYSSRLGYATSYSEGKYFEVVSQGIISVACPELQASSTDNFSSYISRMYC
jgi:hypothetical protein